MYGSAPSRDMGRSILTRAVAYKLQEQAFGGRNLAVGIFVRRLFWLKRTDDTHAGRAPFNAVDPKTIRPGVPGTPVGGRTERWMES